MVQEDAFTWKVPAEAGGAHPTAGSLDHDTSLTRYLDPVFIQKKEEKVLQHDLWALSSEERLKEHHALYEEKLEILRSKDGDHSELVKEWTEHFLKKLDTILP